MSKEIMDQPASSNDSTVRAPYETPAIVYEGLITTRAGTGQSAPNDSGVDAADIFKN